MADGIVSEKVDDGPEDRSLEVATYLSQAKAVADLVSALVGPFTDGSASNIEDIEPSTLRAAMDLIRSNIEKAEETQKEQDKFEQRLGAEQAAGMVPHA
jgi:hypothetical protein